MKYRISVFLTFSLLLAAAIRLFSQGESNVVKLPLTIGETLEFDSKLLEETRNVNVYLPASYDVDSLKSYPVIYLLDGSLDEDFIHVAGLVQFASFSWIKMLPESILVGISNVDRRRDFTFPTRNEKDKEAFPTSGKSSTFIKFIEEELKPLIENNYRCNEKSTLIGQSLGGLLATEILIKNSSLFDNYIIVSPSMWWDDGSLFDRIPGKVEQIKNIYIGVGKEGDIMEGDAMTLYTRVLKNKTEKTRVFFRFLEDQDHGDALHLAIYDAFEKIYSVDSK